MHCAQAFFATTALCFVVNLGFSASQLQQNRTVCGECSDRCSSSSELCNCDAVCQIYKDCCSGWDDCNFKGQSIIPGPYPPFQCHLITVTIGREYNWMVSECPADWSDQDVEANCLSADSNSHRLPPVTDVSTGFVYRNEFCAACNGVVDIAVWRYALACTDELQALLEQDRITITESVLAEFCYIKRFVPPSKSHSLPLVPRICIPSITKCLPFDQIEGNITRTDYNGIVDQCRNNVVQQLVGNNSESGIPYHNAYCAQCNNAIEMSDMCSILSPSRNTEGLVPSELFSFSATLDIFGDGRIVVSSRIISVNITVSCFQNEVYDPVSKTCRQALVCDGVTIGSCGNSDCNDTLIDLTRSVDFTSINSTAILYNGEVFAIEFNTSEGDPVICVDLNRNGTREENATINIYGYPAAFSILTYIGCSLSVIGTVLLLLTYCVFKELRTLPSKILMNLASVILVTNLFIILGVPVSLTFPDVVNLCVGTAVLLHFFFLSQFSWMSIMSFEMTRIFYEASRLKTKETKNECKILSLYMFVGWSIPLLITVITIIVNYTKDGLVLYGELPDGSLGSCWINHLESAVIAFVSPLSISLIFNAITFIIVSVLLCKAARSQAKLGKGSTRSYFRVNVAVFTTSGLTWLFGFLAILARTSWSWYPFIIFNSTQGFVIYLAFACTKRVAKMYANLLSQRKTFVASRSSSSTRQTLVAMGSFTKTKT